MERKKEFIDHLKMTGYVSGTINRMGLYLDYFKKYLTIKRINNNIKEITPAVIDKYKTYLFNYRKKTRESLCLSSISSRLQVIKQYYNYLVRKKYILYDPTTRLELPEIKESLPKSILNEKEILNLLSKPNINTRRGLRDRAILETIYSTGLRRQEIINLNLYDVDIKEGIIKVIKGKGNKDRTVPVGKTACYYIKEYIERVRNKWLKDTKEKSLFITIEGKRLKSGSLGYMIKKYNSSITCHSLRHSCATHMLKGGADIRVIQAILGHSSQNTTQIYTRVMPLDLKQMLRRCHPREKEKKVKKMLAKING